MIEKLEILEECLSNNGVEYSIDYVDLDCDYEDGGGWEYLIPEASFLTVRKVEICLVENDIGYDMNYDEEGLELFIIDPDAVDWKKYRGWDGSSIKKFGVGKRLNIK